MSSQSFYYLFTHSALLCLLVAMTSRRRPAPDLTTLKRSRNSFTGAITKAKDKLLAMKATPIIKYDTRGIERFITSVAHTETGFLQTIEEAQEFFTEEVNMEALQKEEDDALDHFNNSIAEVRDLAQELLTLKSIKTGITSFNKDLKTLRDLFNDQPELKQDSAIQRPTHPSKQNGGKQTCLRNMLW